MSHSEHFTAEYFDLWSSRYILLCFYFVFEGVWLKGCFIVTLVLLEHVKNLQTNQIFCYMCKGYRTFSFNSKKHLKADCKCVFIIANLLMSAALQGTLSSTLLHYRIPQNILLLGPVWRIYKITQTLLPCLPGMNSVDLCVGLCKSKKFPLLYFHLVFNQYNCKVLYLHVKSFLQQTAVLFWVRPCQSLYKELFSCHFQLPVVFGQCHVQKHCSLERKSRQRSYHV